MQVPEFPDFPSDIFSFFAEIMILMIVISVVFFIIVIVVLVKVCRPGAVISKAVDSFVVEAPQFAIPASQRGKTRTDGAQIKTVRLPTTCPNCSAAISQEKIDWVGPLEAKCNYCGATVRAKLENM